MKVGKKELNVKARAGFPKQLYLSIVDLLVDRGYEVKKSRDWLEVSPHSKHYEKVMKKQKTIGEMKGKLLGSQSELRKEYELIRHDLRKLRQQLKHFEEGDEHVLKSHFVDSVDKPLGERDSILGLVQSGIFPTLKDDFMEATGEDWIKKADIPESEKGVLKKKWRIYQHWKKYYGKELPDKVEMLESELRAKKAGLEDIKAQLRPYVKAAKQLKTEEEISLTDPELIEGYIGKVAGVELVGWKKISEWPWFFTLDFRRITREKGRREEEELNLRIDFYIKSKDEFAREKEKIKAKERKVEKEIEEFGKSYEEVEAKEKKGGIMQKALKGLKNLTRKKTRKKPPQHSISEATKELEELWEFIKEKATQ